MYYKLHPRQHSGHSPSRDREEIEEKKSIKKKKGKNKYGPTFSTWAYPLLVTD
jgi:hypothetical protein